MKKKYLSEADHLVRHCSYPVLIHENGRVVGVFPQAFELREDEDYLSASWFEFFDGDRKRRLTLTVASMAKARTVKGSHGLAIGNVGEVKEACLSFGQKVRVIHEPSKKNPNPAYAALRNFSSSEFELLELLANEAWSDVVSVGDYL